MVVCTPDKEYLFEFEKTQPTIIRNKMRPVVTALAHAQGAAVAESGAAVAGVPAQTPPIVQESIPDQIKQLADLRDQGIVTNEEFEAKKADLLARM
jgi:hypothetical protein